LSQDIRDLLRSTDVIGGDVRYLINRKEPKVPNGDAGSDGAAMKEVLAKLNDIEERIRRPVPAASRPDQKEFTEEAVRLTEVKMLVGRLMMICERPGGQTWPETSGSIRWVNKCMTFEPIWTRMCATCVPESLGSSATRWRTTASGFQGSGKRG